MPDFKKLFQTLLLLACSSFTVANDNIPDIVVPTAEKELPQLANSTNNEHEEEATAVHQFRAVPFVMSLEDWGFTFALGGVAKGVIQPQASVFAGGAYSENGTYLAYAGMFNLMIPGWDHLMFDASVQESDFSNTRFFLSDNTVGAGGNDSSENQYIRTPAHQKYYRLFMKYTLPIGDGREGALPAIIGQTQGSDAGRVWNPVASGITILEVEPYYRTQTLDHYPGLEADTSAGVRFTLEYDNRNSKTLPTRGNVSKVRVTHDPGSSNRADWTIIELEYSQFFNLGSSNYLDERVIAVNAWLADTPTWNSKTDVNGEPSYRRPPSFAGVTLGGFDRMRGYSGQRFHGRSAAYYSFEYRMMPKWQPLNTLPLIGDFYHIPWWQWTLFTDVGRVADNFDLSELHSQMKTSFGGGIRFMVEGITVRAEMVGSAEDRMVRIFINQPF